MADQPSFSMPTQIIIIWTAAVFSMDSSCLLLHVQLGPFICLQKIYSIILHILVLLWDAIYSNYSSCICHTCVSMLLTAHMCVYATDCSHVCPRYWLLTCVSTLLTAHMCVHATDCSHVCLCYWLLTCVSTLLTAHMCVHATDYSYPISRASSFEESGWFVRVAKIPVALSNG